eukprot:Lithocolla_globosa_v1_NODE_10007_length_644_cov_6.874363.p1 type:complete len:140 gc:universal NODE_10007_length_644_cov_6.874363:426-7(-)
MRDKRVLKQLISGLFHNTTDLYRGSHSFLTKRAHECYYVTTHLLSPIVYKEWRDQRLIYGPDLSVELLPERLRVREKDGLLYYPLVTDAMRERGYRWPLWGVVDTCTTSELLQYSIVDDNNQFWLQLNGEKTELKTFKK